MSSNDKTDSSDKPKPSPAQITASIEADIAELSELLSKDTLDDAGEASVAELLARLENADGVAKGVESKLDALLGNLDNLLASLENNEGPTHVEPEQPSAQPTDEKSTEKDP
ncbi:hypothetical protein B0H19DRAFT_1128928 [Mycena capillaripes]|nr:hypothetical protein B0H19DRAFT_1128928 [Mycena capillaripes]